MKKVLLSMIVVITLLILFLTNLLWDNLKLKLFEKAIIVVIILSVVFYFINQFIKEALLAIFFFHLIPLLIIIKSSFEIKPHLVSLIIVLFLTSLWLIGSMISLLKPQDNSLKTYLTNKFKKWSVIINYFVFYLAPYLIIFLVLISPLLFMSLLNNENLNLSTILGFMISLFGLIIYLISQVQFVKNQGMNKGIRSKSRYPEYFGEMLFVIGLFLMTLSLDEGLWLLFVGPLLHLLMYQWFVIPIKEKMRKLTSGYDKYIEQTNLLIPFRLKKNV